MGVEEHEDLISYHLHRSMARIDTPRPYDRIHASDVTNEEWCHRRHALLWYNKMQGEGSFVGTATDLVWAQGRNLANYVIHKLKTVDIAIGDWRCANCGAMIRYSKHPGYCRSCTCKSFLYEEVRVTSPISGVSCGLDLIVDLPARKKNLLVEIKTIDKVKFQGLKAPLAEHRVRTQIYLRSVAESVEKHAEFIETEEARILYISKGGYGEKSKKPKEWGLKDQAYTPFKEFVVQRDDESVESYMKNPKELYEFQTKVAGWPQRPCATAYSNRAQGCEVKDLCFSGSEPGEKPSDW